MKDFKTVLLVTCGLFILGTSKPTQSPVTTKIDTSNNKPCYCKPEDRVYGYHHPPGRYFSSEGTESKKSEATSSSETSSNTKECAGSSKHSKPRHHRHSYVFDSIKLAGISAGLFAKDVTNFRKQKVEEYENERDKNPGILGIGKSSVKVAAKTLKDAFTELAKNKEGHPIDSLVKSVHLVGDSVHKTYKNSLNFVDTGVQHVQSYSSKLIDRAKQKIQES